jgi:hypothetical protein
MSYLYYVASLLLFVAAIVLVLLDTRKGYSWRGIQFEPTILRRQVLHGITWFMVSLVFLTSSLWLNAGGESYAAPFTLATITVVLLAYTDWTTRRVPIRPVFVLGLANVLFFVSVAVNGNATIAFVPLTYTLAMGAAYYFYALKGRVGGSDWRFILAIAPATALLPLLAGIVFVLAWFGTYLVWGFIVKARGGGIPVVTVVSTALLCAGIFSLVAELNIR